jgi:hypothetical protein
VIAIVSGIIVGAVLWGNERIFTDNLDAKSAQFMMVMILFLVSQIPFSMTISTLFNDSKVANYVGGLLLTFPIIIFLQFMIIDSDAKYVLYLFYFIPVMPACGILVKLTSITADQLTLPLPDGILLNTEFISNGASWFCLIICIPFWFVVYIYLDNVMPNTYGV